METTALNTNTLPGENDLDYKYSPDEGALVFTRTLNNPGAIPAIFKFQFGATN